MSCKLVSNPEMIRLQAQIFNDVRPDGARLFLLKRAGETQKFVAVIEITTGWNAIFDKEFRDEMKVSIATETSIADEIAQSSFIGYGLGASGDEIDVFPFDKKDAVQPNATSPSWKLHAKRDGRERFLIPAISGLPLPIPTITTLALAGATQGAAYHQTITTSGGTATSFSVIRGNLPAGIVFNFSTRSFDGTPTESGDFEFDFAIYNADGFYSYRTFTLRVALFVPPPPTALVNFAFAGLGSTVSATSTFPGYVPSVLIDGNRLFSPAVWDNVAWHSSGAPVTVQINFNQSRQITKFGIFTVRDNSADKSPNTLTETFNQYGVTDFTIQHWNGTVWVNTVPPVAGNDKVWREFAFAPVTTLMMRVIITGVLLNNARLLEIEAWG